MHRADLVDVRQPHNSRGDSHDALGAGGAQMELANRGGHQAVAGGVELASNLGPRLRLPDARQHMFVRFAALSGKVLANLLDR
jgi:hypothetical protein